jgi:three-Cys-motif partner protein
MTEFFQKQTGLTAIKLKIFKNYLEKYLPKLLMQFDECLVADLFCGAGKNGEQDGSPLVLLRQAEYFLSSPEFITKKIHILFNDKDSNNVINLTDELGKIEICERIAVDKVSNLKFKTLLPVLLETLREDKKPKFIFLDPFTYSDVKMSDLKLLMKLQRAEVLLFLPVFHSYRFASDHNMGDDHKTRIFVEKFTENGVADYEDIDEYLSSIKNKIKTELSLQFVRQILIDGGGCKNALLLLTKHKSGMLEMNKVAFKLSENGFVVKQKHSGQASLFGHEVSGEYADFKKSLICQFENKSELSNEELVEFTIEKGYLPKHLKKVLVCIYDKGNIVVYDEDDEKVVNKNKWYIAEKIKGKRKFVWRSRNENQD